MMSFTPERPECIIFHEVNRRDWPTLAVRLMWEYQVGVDVHALGQACERVLAEMRNVAFHYWSRGMWRLWLKKRLHECGVFKGGNEVPFSDSHWSRSPRNNRDGSLNYPHINDPDGLIRTLRSTYSGTASYRHYGITASHVS